MSICIPAFLLFVHILAESSLLFGRQLAPVRRGKRIDIRGRALRSKLFTSMSRDPSCTCLNKFSSLVVHASRRGPLSVCSRVFAHYVLEGCLIEVAARLLLGRLVDLGWPSSRV